MKLILALVVAGVIAMTCAYVYRNWIIANTPVSILYPALGSVFGFRARHNVMIPMRDGVSLATDLLVPTRGDGKYPAILVRLPYGKDRYFEARHTAIWFARRGYAVAAQDMRGRFQSEGEFAPYPRDGEDGSDTVDWLARQPWSNGKVGTFGCSALGETQVLLARERNVHHAAMISLGSGGAVGSAGDRYTYFGVFEGGVLNLASTFGWFAQHGGKTPETAAAREIDVAALIGELPVVGLVGRARNDPTDYEAFVSTPLHDPFWREMGYVADDDRFATPALLVNTWHDQTVAETLVTAELMRKNWDDKSSKPNVRVIIGPGNHCDFWGPAQIGRVGDLAVSPDAARPFNEWFLSWFDYLLRDNGVIDSGLPAYRFFVLGEDRWVDSAQWPPAGVQKQRWYLGGSRAANSVSGGGVLAQTKPTGSTRYDEFQYDPREPVPTRGGPICCTGNPADRSGPVDQRDVESRKDVLLYTSDPLPEGLRLAGPLHAELYVSSSAVDTDFVVKLVDVRPDGSSLNIQEGALRMRYRDSFTQPQLMQPGEVYFARISMRAIAYHLPAGHRLRLQVTSSNFPRLERNLNTGGRNFDEVSGVIAVNQVHTTRKFPSSVIIPKWLTSSEVDSAAID